MQNKVLVPTDFSKPAWNAIVYAINLFRQVPATFYILNSFKSSALFDEENLLKEKSQFGIEKVMQGLKFRKENSSHHFEGISSGKKLSDAITDVVSDKKIELIILGIKTESRSRLLSFSTRIKDLIENMNIPILLVPENLTLDPQKVNEIVFPTNFKFPFQKDELHMLKFFAHRFNIPIRILFVEADITLDKLQEEHKHYLIKMLENCHVSFHHLKYSQVLEGIYLFVQSRESGFIAIYQRKQNLFRKLFSEAIIESLEFDSTVPILVLKEQKAHTSLSETDRD